LKNIYLYFSIGNGQPREPALCQLYRHTHFRTLWKAKTPDKAKSASHPYTLNSARYNSDVQQLDSIISDRNVADRVFYHLMSSVSALPRERRTAEIASFHLNAAHRFTNEHRNTFALSLSRHLKGASFLFPCFTS